MRVDYLAIIKAFAKHLAAQTATPVIIAPSEVKSERFHVELTLLPHPVLVGNGRARFRMRATVFAEVPPSDVAINDCLEKSLRLSLFFDQTEGFCIAEGVYAIAYFTPLRDDDDLFSDLDNEERAYFYSESWLVELEFNVDDFFI